MTIRRGSPGPSVAVYQRAVAAAILRISANVHVSAMTPRHPSVPKAIFKASEFPGSGSARGWGAPE